MSQRHSISGRRSGLVWLAILLLFALVTLIAVVALLIVPEQAEKRALVRATVETEARLAAEAATAQAETAEVERQYQAGVAFQAAGRWDDAIAAFTEVVRRAPGYKDASARMAQVSQTRVAAGASADATATAKMQVEQGGRATATAEALEAHYQKGIGYINLKQWLEAQAELRAVFGADPNYRDVQAQLALVNTEITKLTPAATATSSASPAPTRTPMLVSLRMFSEIGDPVSMNPNGPFDLLATAAYQPYAGWARIAGATHIWYQSYQAGSLYFAKTIEIPDQAERISAKIEITADNFFNLWLNEVEYGGTAPPATNSQWSTVNSYELRDMHPGTNRLLIRATEDDAGTSSMLIYSLTITYRVP